MSSASWFGMQMEKLPRLPELGSAAEINLGNQPQESA